jgi:hypothetical protein
MPQYSKLAPIKKDLLKNIVYVHYLEHWVTRLDYCKTVNDLKSKQEIYEADKKALQIEIQDLTNELRDEKSENAKLKNELSLHVEKNDQTWTLIHDSLQTLKQGDMWGKNTIESDKKIFHTYAEIKMWVYQLGYSKHFCIDPKCHGYNNEHFHDHKTDSAEISSTYVGLTKKQIYGF